MILHEYGEWHEPERAPFTVEDVIRAIQEVMLRASVSFDQALRMLLRQGLPLNAFLQVNGLDRIIGDLIEKLENLKERDRESHDLERWLRAESDDLRRMADEVERDLQDDAPAQDTFRQIRRSGETRHRAVPLADLQRLLRLGWRLAEAGSRPRGGGPMADRLEHYGDRLQRLRPLEAFHEREKFRGTQPVDASDARRLEERFQAIDRLKEELREALENGNLLHIDAERVRELLGREASEAFGQKRDELLARFDEALEKTGQVTQEDGIYKLTPAAARKLGSAFLTQVFSLLKTDGMGKHAATEGGSEGSTESVRTRPWEFGDSLAHLDLPSSMVNALVREGAGLPIRMRADDFEVHQTVGMARTALAVLIDMSGSMERMGRFYNAKKVALALDALVRAQFPEDRVFFIGFGTFARQYKVGDILSLAPFPVTMFGAHVRLTVDFDALSDATRRRGIPRYFTNTQKALELARRLLSREESANRHVILITDGVPTAYYLGPRLKLTYPPEHQTFHETLREVRACTDAGITINTFMLTSDWEFDYHGEREFVEKMVAINGGRMFYPSPDSLTKYVLVDYIHHKKQMFAL